MTTLTHLFVNDDTHQMYRSPTRQAGAGWQHIGSYTDGIGDSENDAQSLDNELVFFHQNDYAEIPDPNLLRVRLYYMKASGKFYSSGFVEVPAGEAKAHPSKSFFELVNHVEQLLADRKLPGLVEGAVFSVLIMGEDHPGGYPHMLYPSNWSVRDDS